MWCLGSLAWLQLLTITFLLKVESANKGKSFRNDIGPTKTSLYCTGKGIGEINERIMYAMPNLEQANIVCRDKGITSISKTALYLGNRNSTEKVKFIDLSNNAIQFLIVGTLDFPELQELHLKNNQMRVVEAGLLRVVVLLRIIDLSRNRLTTLEGDWSHLMLLQSINLAENKLTTMRKQNFNLFITGRTNILRTLDITGNEIKCDCNLVWLIASEPRNIFLARPTTSVLNSFQCIPTGDKDTSKSDKNASIAYKANNSNNKLTLVDLINSKKVKKSLTVYMKDKCSEKKTSNTKSDLFVSYQLFYASLASYFILAIFFYVNVSKNIKNKQVKTNDAGSANKYRPKKSLEAGHESILVDQLVNPEKDKVVSTAVANEVVSSTNDQAAQN